MAGSQTALVVGPSGEEIWTDEHGRIKVQFHWDRMGVKDENSSCWVRVSQSWAGQAWGSPVGIFLSALVLTAAGNAFARWANRPGALIRVPGILMLVPGSTSLRGLLTLVQQQDVGVGQSALLAVTNVVMALIAGLLFGNLLISSRKNL